MRTSRTVSTAELVDLFLSLAKNEQSPGGAKIYKSEVARAVSPAVYDGLVTRSEVGAFQRHLPDLMKASHGAKNLVAAFRAEHGPGRGQTERLRRKEAFDRFESTIRYGDAPIHGRAPTLAETEALLGLLGDAPSPARTAQVAKFKQWIQAAGHATDANLAAIDTWLAAHPITRPGEPLQSLLEPITGALKWPSESWEKIETVSFGRARTMPGTANMLERLGESASTKIELHDFDEVFSELTRPEDAGDAVAGARQRAFVELRDVLKRELTDLRVYRVGQIDMDVFVLGRTKDGELAGLMTSVVET
jgi:hypothetical protein